MPILIIRQWGIVIVCSVLSWILVACGTPGAMTRNQPPMTLDALYAFCGIPASCGSAVTWEDRWVTVKGYADPDNVFHKQHHPKLPYEKFRLIDRKGKSVEVWINSPDSRPIFSKIHQKLNAQIIVKGRLAVVKMPQMGACRLSAKVWIDDPSQIR